MPISNLLADLPVTKAQEITDVLLSARGVRLERIVSYGQASPDAFWYDQEEAEWVMLLTGAARLAIEGEDDARHLVAGDVVYLPAHCRHRVAWTAPDQPTVWLALFVDATFEPTIDAGES